MNNGCLNCGGVKARKRQKYCSNHCQLAFQKKEFLKQWLSGEVEGGDNKYGSVYEAVREYLFDKYKSKCSRCGWDEVNSSTGKVPLQVEHIDGNGYNHEVCNLTLLCPNCHSLTGTYMALNKGNGRKERKEYRGKYDKYMRGL